MFCFVIVGICVYVKNVNIYIKKKALENVEDPFTNMLSSRFSRQGDWAMGHDFYIKEHISNDSKIFSPLSLNITNIYDLMEEVTPSIYYMVSWLEESLKNKKEVYLFYKNVEGAHHFYTPDDHISFYIEVYLYDKFPKNTGWYWTEAHTHKIIVDFKFKFDDLTKGENILTRIKTRINEELKKILVILLLIPVSLKS